MVKNIYCLYCLLDMLRNDNDWFPVSFVLIAVNVENDEEGKEYYA